MSLFTALELEQLEQVRANCTEEEYEKAIASTQYMCEYQGVVVSRLDVVKMIASQCKELLSKENVRKAGCSPLEIEVLKIINEFWDGKLKIEEANNENNN